MSELIWQVGVVFVITLVSGLIYKGATSPTRGRNLQAAAKQSNEAYPWIPMPPNIPTNVWIDNVKYRATAHRPIKDASGGNVQQVQYIFAPNKLEMETLYPGRWMWGDEASSLYGYERNIHVFTKTQTDVKDVIIDTLHERIGILEAQHKTDLVEKENAAQPKAVQELEKGMEEHAAGAVSPEGYQKGGLDTTGVGQSTAQALQQLAAGGKT